jgi:hypothetical protein
MVNGGRCGRSWFVGDDTLLVFGFMETSARNTVNIEDTFALIVRRVVEARRVAASGVFVESRFR